MSDKKNTNDSTKAVEGAEAFVTADEKIDYLMKEGDKETKIWIPLPYESDQYVLCVNGVTQLTDILSKLPETNRLSADHFDKMSEAVQSNEHFRKCLGILNDVCTDMVDVSLAMKWPIFDKSLKIDEMLQRIFGKWKIPKHHYLTACSDTAVILHSSNLFSRN